MTVEELLKWAEGLARARTILKTPVRYQEAPLRPVTVTEVGRTAHGCLAAVTMGRYWNGQSEYGASPWHPREYWDRMEADALHELETMRDAVGPDVDLMIDINQGWDVDRAITIGREMAAYGIRWLEDPTKYDDFAGLARIAAALDTPIAAGEYVYGLSPFRQLIEQRSIDIVMVDLLRVGGITQWMKVAHMAEAANLPVVTHLAPEVLVHALAAVPNGLTVEYMPWSFPLFKWVPPAVNGEIELPQAPGLGLEFDDEALEKATLAL